jgi:hypothetical protein
MSNISNTVSRMTEIPTDPTEFDVQLVPVEQVQLDYSLLVDQGQGPQVFHVGKVRFRSIQGPDGTYVGTYLLASEPVEGNDPWEIEYPSGTQVSRILGPTQS